MTQQCGIGPTETALPQNVFYLFLNLSGVWVSLSELIVLVYYVCNSEELYTYS